MIDLTKRVRIAPKRTGGTTEILDLATVRGELETKLLDLGDASALQAHLRELCTPPPERSEPAPDLTQTLVLAQPQNLTQTCVIAPAPNLAETCVKSPPSPHRRRNEMRRGRRPRAARVRGVG